MSETPPRKQTRNKTFRLDELTCEILEREAIDRNVSVNEMINELILKEFGQGTIFKSRKIIRVNLLTLQLITGALPDEKIIEIGEKIASDALLKDLPLEIAGDASFEAIQKTMKFLAGHWAFEYSEVEHAGKKVIILAHYVERSYSLLLGTYWKTLLLSTGAKVDFSADNDAVLFRFE